MISSEESNIQEFCNILYLNHYFVQDSSTQQPSSVPSHLTPTQTTQMYCQTIGRIRPGKCLSYTTSLQAVASTNPSTKPVLLPLLTEGAGARDQQTPYYDNQSSDGESLNGVSTSACK